MRHLYLTRICDSLIFLMLQEMSSDDIANSDCEQMLKDIAKEQKFEEYHVPIEEKAHSGKFNSFS